MDKAQPSPHPIGVGSRVARGVVAPLDFWFNLQF